MTSIAGNLNHNFWQHIGGMGIYQGKRTLALEEIFQ
jgi:hypothetical protein